MHTSVVSIQILFVHSENVDYIHRAARQGKVVRYPWETFPTLCRCVSSKMIINNTVAYFEMKILLGLYNLEQGCDRLRILSAICFAYPFLFESSLVYNESRCEQELLVLDCCGVQFHSRGKVFWSY